MKTWNHGGDIYAYSKPVLDFSSNLNPLGFPAGVREAICSCADECRYPDPFCRALTRRLAEHEQVSPEWILCGNGAADLIYRLIWAVKPRRGMVLAPGFSEYGQALRTVEAEVVYYDLLRKDSFELTERILPGLAPDLDCIFLCSPNNPTGLTIAPELFKAIIKKATQSGILVVLDECFLDLLDDPERYSAKKYLPEYRNLFLLRAFTKTYAMAGLRLGYGLCADPFLLDRMQHSGPPWTVSTVAQAAGVQALSDPDYLPKTRQLLHTERDFLKRGLTECGCRVWDSKANYLFFAARRGLREQLLAQGILIRSCGNYRGLDDTYYRIAVRLHWENERLLSAVQKLGDCHESIE